MERSLAFTALLELPWFARLESRAGSDVVTAFVADWKARGRPHMMALARERWADGVPA